MTEPLAIIVVKRIGKMFSRKTGTPVALQRPGEDHVIEEVQQYLVPIVNKAIQLSIFARDCGFSVTPSPQRVHTEVG